MVLQIEVDVWADALDEVVQVADEIVIGFIDTLAVCLNAAIDTPQTLAIFDVTPGHRERVMRQYAFEPQYRGLTPVRCEATEIFDPTLRAIYFTRVDAYKVGLAMAHYRAALGFFGASGLIFSFEFLCITAEILAESFVKRELEARSVPFSNKAVKALAKEYGHDPETLKNWRYRLYDEISVRDIFDGDGELFKTVGNASNGFEHGTMTADAIRSVALQTTPLLFRKLRSAFIKLANIDLNLLSTPGSWEPVGFDPVREFIDVTLTGPGETFESFGASPDQAPTLSVTYEYTSVTVNDGHLSVARRVNVRPRVGEDVSVGSLIHTSMNPFNVTGTAKLVEPGDEDEHD
jgi:hypothetical protein